MKMDIKNKKKWALIALAVVVLVFIGINAKSIGQKFGIVGGGTISLTVPLSGSTVYMDGKRLQVTDANNKTLSIKNVGTAKPHEILVSKQGYWPWSKAVSVADGKTLDLRAFNGLAGQKVEELKPASPDYAKAVAALQKIPAPTKEKMMISKSTLVGLWTEDRHVYARWLPSGTPEDFFCLNDACNHGANVFRGTGPITSVAFYRNRDDVVLFSTGGSIYAIEIDENGTQNFQPVYEGTNTVFVTADENTLYIKDSGKILKLHFQ